MRNAQPGWYRSKADRADSARFWDGSAWTGEPVNRRTLISDLAPINSSIASTVDRVLARFIDWIVWGAIYITALWISNLFDFDEPTTRGLSVGITAVGIAIYETSLVSTRSATLGKRFLGLRVVGSEELEAQAVPGVNALQRITPFLVVLGLVAIAVALVGTSLAALVFVVCVVPLTFHSLLVSQGDRMGRTSWDKFSKTVVVKSNDQTKPEK